MTEEQAFIEWKAEQYKHQSTEEELEFVEHLHYFPRYFKKTFIDGYKECQKEHEWHYVKDELPELYKDVLVVFSQGNCDVKRLTKQNEWVGRGSWCSLTDVIAWKEIVLPELSKENE